MLTLVAIVHESRSRSDTRGSKDAVSFQARSHTSREAPISFVMPVLPSVRLRQRGSHWMDVREILYWQIAHDNVRKIVQIWVKPRQKYRAPYVKF